jgi:hypothetical protein
MVTRQLSTPQVLEKEEAPQGELKLVSIKISAPAGVQPTKNEPPDL